MAAVMIQAEKRSFRLVINIRKTKRDAKRRTKR